MKLSKIQIINFAEYCFHKYLVEGISELVTYKQLYDLWIPKQLNDNGLYEESVAMDFAEYCMEQYLDEGVSPEKNPPGVLFNDFDI
jgi:hypothetical protein